MARARKTQRFSDVADTTLARIDRAGRRQGARVISAWPAVVGPEIARHTQGFALRDDRELVVFVDGPAWANELSLMAEDLMLRLNEHLGEKTVRTIRFTVSKRVSEERSWEAALSESEDEYLPDEVTPERLSEVERMQVEHVSSVVTDPELRELAQRVMTKDLELKKGAKRAASQEGQGAADETPPHEG